MAGSTVVACEQRAPAALPQSKLQATAGQSPAALCPQADAGAAPRSPGACTHPRAQHQEGLAAPAQQVGQLYINGAAPAAPVPGTFLPCIIATLKTMAWRQGLAQPRLWQPRNAATSPEALMNLLLRSHRPEGSQPCAPLGQGSHPRGRGTRWDRRLPDRRSQEAMAASGVCSPPHRAGPQEGDFHFHSSKPAAPAPKHQGNKLKPPH